MSCDSPFKLKNSTKSKKPEQNGNLQNRKVAVGRKNIFLLRTEFFFCACLTVRRLAYSKFLGSQGIKPLGEMVHGTHCKGWNLPYIFFTTVPANSHDRNKINSPNLLF
jgi:hypothetical protein